MLSNMSNTRLIVLLTDFGEEDGYVGIMKGVIHQISPQSDLIDLSHTVPPQDILAGSMTLQRAVDFFEPGSVFVCVIDPGVGTARRSIAAKIGDRFFIGPDNGLITHWVQEAEKHHQTISIVELDQPQYWLGSLSNSFHGRDVYAPTGAHLSTGLEITQLGTLINDPVLLDVPQPIPTNRGWDGQILHIDHFGNLATNIEKKHLVAFAPDINLGIPNAWVRYGEYSIEGVSATFGKATPGSLVAMIDSAGLLSIAVVNGNAQEYLDAEIGDTVRIIRDNNDLSLEK